jgi:hypothetical protein
MLTIANPTTDLTGEVTLNFHGSSRKFDAEATYQTGLSCANQVARLEHIKEASCWKVTSLPHFGAQYVIRIDEFFAWSSNNLFTTDGNPPISAFTCDVADVPVGTTCTFLDVDLSMEASGFADLGPSVTYVVTIANGETLFTGKPRTLALCIRHRSPSTRHSTSPAPLSRWRSRRLLATTLVPLGMCMLMGYRLLLLCSPPQRLWNTSRAQFEAFARRPPAVVTVSLGFTVMLAAAYLILRRLMHLMTGFKWKSSAKCSRKLF